MDLGLKDKIAIVTGGGVGIGKVMARELAAEGVNVALCSLRLPILEAAAAEISNDFGVGALPVAADVTSQAQVNAMVETVAKHFGRIDVLINNAAAPGGAVRAELDAADDETLLHDLDTKVLGYFRCAKAVAPVMREQQWGRIINIGGLTGRTPVAVSGMRNVAIVHLSKTLSDQLGPHGITVNTVHPGVVDSDYVDELLAKRAAAENTSADAIKRDYEQRTPIRRILEPDEIAHAVLFLASTKAAAITGETLGVDGGFSRGIFF